MFSLFLNTVQSYQRYEKVAMSVITCIVDFCHKFCMSSFHRTDKIPPLAFTCCGVTW